MEAVISALLCEPARVAILGTGGIGKTALAITALHSPGVQEKYVHRHFISCESANTCADLIGILGSHLGLAPTKQLSLAIVKHLASLEAIILVLDNLETPWEPPMFRSQVEDFLCLLTDIPQLALVVSVLLDWLKQAY